MVQEIQQQEFNCPEIFEKTSEERLFLGCTKKQDVERIYSRKDFREILPFLHQISLYYPEKKAPCNRLNFREWKNSIIPDFSCLLFKRNKEKCRACKKRLKCLTEVKEKKSFKKGKIGYVQT